jgi:quinol monooxygenase YgiN
LKELINQVRNEPNHVNIVIHVDPIDKINILFYEEWSNEDYYKGEHLQTPYLQKFMGDAKAFLAGPPEITFWNI